MPRSVTGLTDTFSTTAPLARSSARIPVVSILPGDATGDVLAWDGAAWANSQLANSKVSSVTASLPLLAAGTDDVVLSLSGTADIITTGLVRGGTLGAGYLSLTGETITSSSGSVDFGNSDMNTNGSFQAGTLIMTAGAVYDLGGSLSFNGNNLSTTGTLTAGVATLGSGSTAGTLSLGSGSVTDSSGAIDFGTADLSTTGTLSTGGQTIESDIVLYNPAALADDRRVYLNISTSGGFRLGAQDSVGGQQPAITFSRDGLNIDQIVYNADTHSFQNGIGSAGRMTITSTGVGVGITPSFALDVYGDIVSRGNSGDSNRGIHLVGRNEDGVSYTNYNGGLASWYGIGFKALTDGVTRLMFDTRTGYLTITGYLGIGIAAPTAQLSVGAYFTLQASNASYMGAMGFNRGVETGLILNPAYAAFQIHNYQGQLVFQNYNSAGAAIDSNLLVMNNGKVGIGVSPSYKLHLNAIDDSCLYTSSQTYSAYGIRFGGWYGTYSTTNHLIQSSLNLHIDSASAGHMYLNYYSQKNVLVGTSSTGNLGVGTQSPSERLHVHSDVNAGIRLSSSTTAEWSLYALSSTRVGRFEIQCTLGTDTLPFSIWPSSDTYLMCLKGSSVGIKTDNPLDDFDINGNCLIRDQLLGGYNNGANNFHIDAYNSGASTRGIYLNYYTGTGVYLAGGTPVTSDRRLKKNIKTMEPCLARMCRLRGVEFNWVKANRPTCLQIGVIAQEVEREFPDLVCSDGYDNLAVIYGNFVAPFIECFKELAAENEALRARVKRLEDARPWFRGRAREQQLEARLRALEAALIKK